MSQNCGEIGSSNPMTGWIDTNAITRITTKNHRIKWTIENISKLAFNTFLITGPDLQLSPTVFVGISFKIKKPHLFVYITNKSEAEIQIGIKLYLCECHGRKIFANEDSKFVTLDKGGVADTLGILRYIDNLPDNKLVIDLSISMTGETKTKIYHSQQMIDSQKKLIENLKTMQENAVSSDLSVQIGNESIPVHWSILCSRVPYFKKMFDSRMSERVENSITITDLSLGTFKKFTEFLYTADFAEDDIEELFDLYYAADKYEVMDMRAICASRIMAKVTAENVCQIFQLAHRHSDKDFKMQAMDFIQFHFDAVFETEGWTKFEASEPLAAELLSFCMRTNKV